MASDHHILLTAQERIGNPQFWCQGAAMEDDRGGRLEPHQRHRAVRYSAVGVLATNEDVSFEQRMRVIDLLDRAAHELFGLASCEEVNNFGGRGFAHNRVIAVYNRARKLADQGKN